MAANVESILELSLSEAAETIWARHVALEAVRNRAPLSLVIAANRAHALAMGLGQAFSLILALIHDDGITADLLLDEALERIGAQLWDLERAARDDQVVWDIVQGIPKDASWASAVTLASRVAPRSR